MITSPVAQLARLVVAQVLFFDFWSLIFEPLVARLRHFWPF
jgi:hypothetical protein